MFGLSSVYEFEKILSYRTAHVERNLRHAWMLNSPETWKDRAMKLFNRH